MKTRLLIIIVLALVPLSISNVLAMCAAEALEWWEACNDTGPNNPLPLNPILMSVLFVVGIFASIAGIVIWRKRK